MISELYIKDFAIIDELRLRLAPGFSVFTGETGAGKSIILDAVMLLLGGRADTTMVRAGCETAYVEGIFTIPAEFRQHVADLLASEGLEDGDEQSLLLAREVRVEGRNVCRVNGRAVTLSFMRDVSEQLVDIHGQGEHLSLLKPRSHITLLDAYGGLTAERRILRQKVLSLQKTHTELEALRRNARDIAQRIDMLEFQIAEIDAAHLVEGEESELIAERQRLGNVEALIESAGEALALLQGVDDDIPGAASLLNQAQRAVASLIRLDDSKESWLSRMEGLVSEFDELSVELRDYQEELEHNPKRLSYVEERLDLVRNLKRKYGDDIAEILGFREKAAAELDEIEHGEERTKLLEDEIEQRLHLIGELAAELSRKRQLVADDLARAVEAELGDLRLQGALFTVDLKTQVDSEGVYVGDERLRFDATGIDRVEFLISTNPGEPLKPLARVASGGETARLMLALKTALARVDDTPTLIFDEIDQGIGGRVGDVVGRKLWELAQAHDHQVIVVTHLPQLAGYGDRHFHVSKHVTGGRTVTTVEHLEPGGRIAELAAMLGTGDEAARRGAEAILQQAETVKEGV